MPFKAMFEFKVYPVVSFFEVGFQAEGVIHQDQPKDREVAHPPPCHCGFWVDIVRLLWSACWMYCLLQRDSLVQPVEPPLLLATMVDYLFVFSNSHLCNFDLM